MSRVVRVVLLTAASVVASVAAIGCEGEPAESIPAEARTEAQQIFATRCVTCHGERGAGDGPAGAALDPRPRNFGEHEWQESVTDEHIERIVVLGGSAVGKSPAMPGNPDLQGKPDVVRALRAHIRELGQ